uniref:Uncharacterized protein n=1 Tax=Picea sitchensis TaxID=3332 RepID=D5AD64_PICSI|nr:unknown [Picea sitchensis]
MVSMDHIMMARPPVFTVIENGATLHTRSAGILLPLRFSKNDFITFQASWANVWKIFM